MKKPAAIAAAAATAGAPVMKKPAKHAAASDDPMPDESDAELNVRDVMKSRKINLSFDSLPGFIQTEANELKGLKVGTSRHKLTRLINSVIVKNEAGNLMIANMQPFFEEVLMRQKTKFYRKKQGGATTNIISYTHTLL